MFESGLDTEQAFGQDRPMRRTYVRRRLVAASIVIMVVGWGVPAAARSIVSRGPGTVPAITVVVEPGDTVWAIARRFAPAEDPRAVIERIEAANPIGRS
jgi:hypothetical protein